MFKKTFVLLGCLFIGTAALAAGSNDPKPTNPIPTPRCPQMIDQCRYHDHCWQYDYDRNCYSYQYRLNDHELRWCPVHEDYCWQPRRYRYHQDRRFDCPYNR